MFVSPKPAAPATHPAPAGNAANAAAVASPTRLDRFLEAVKLERHPYIWGASFGVGVALSLVGTPPVELAQTGFFGAGALMAVTGLASLARRTYVEWTAGRARNDVSGRAALADIEANFDVILSRLMLSDEKFHAKNLELHREAYARIGTALSENLDALLDRLRRETGRIVEYAQAYEIQVPGGYGDWEAVFAALSENKDKILSDDFAQLMRKKELIGELSGHIGIARRQIAELDALLNVEFPKTVARSAADLRAHRALVAKEDRKLAASRALHENDGDAAVAAVLEHARNLREIAERFVAAFQGLQGDLQDRLSAAAVAEHPALDTALRAQRRAAPQKSAAELALDAARAQASRGTVQITGGKS